VPVQTDTSITPISTSAVPINLQASTSLSIGGTVTLSQADDDGTVVVAAKQMLIPGPIVTVKSQVATVLNVALPVGDYGYNLTLPIGAPSLAAYGPLPITPTPAAQSAVARIYTIQGSAQVVTTTGTTVYATQSPVPSTKDIAIVANQTQDFTLTP
jgi:hypothetical protein